MDDLVQSFYRFSQEMYDSGTDQGTRAAMSRGIKRADNYGGNNWLEGYTNMVDVGGLVDACAQVTPSADDVKDAVDTASVYDIVGDAVKNKRYQLLISLSAHIGDKLLARYPHFLAVTATIRKPSVPISGPIDYVEVETTRTRK